MRAQDIAMDIGIAQYLRRYQRLMDYHVSTRIKTVKAEETGAPLGEKKA